MPSLQRWPSPQKASEPIWPSPTQLSLAHLHSTIKGRHSSRISSLAGNAERPRKRSFRQQPGSVFPRLHSPSSFPVSATQLDPQITGFYCPLHVGAHGNWPSSFRTHPHSLTHTTRSSRSYRDQPPSLIRCALEVGFRAVVRPNVSAHTFYDFLSPIATSLSSCSIAPGTP